MLPAKNFFAKKKNRKSKSELNSSSSLSLLALEQRYLLDAAAAVSAVDSLTQDLADTQADGAIDALGSDQRSTDASGYNKDAQPFDPDAYKITHDGSTGGTEIIVIDPAADNVAELICGIAPTASVHILENDRDGIAQLVQIIGQYDDVSTVHLIPGAIDGGTTLGNTLFSGRSFDAEQRAALQEVSRHFADNAQLRIHGHGQAIEVALIRNAAFVVTDQTSDQSSSANANDTPTPVAPIRASVNATAGPGDPDTDGDGIHDSVDIDDDNDGILDTDEGFVAAGTNLISNHSLENLAESAATPDGFIFGGGFGEFGNDIEDFDLVSGTAEAFHLAGAVTVNGTPVPAFTVNNIPPLAGVTDPGPSDGLVYAGLHSGDGAFDPPGSQAAARETIIYNLPFTLEAGVEYTLLLDVYQADGLVGTSNRNGNPRVFGGIELYTIAEGAVPNPDTAYQDGTVVGGIVNNAGATGISFAGISADITANGTAGTAAQNGTVGYETISITFTPTADFDRFIITPESGLNIYYVIDNFRLFTTTQDITRDTDNDGLADHLDIDSDDDGITDNIEAQASNAFIAASGTGDPATGGSFVDANRDGLDDNFDQTSTGGRLGIAPVDTDADGIPDLVDSDSDNDGLSDLAEGPFPGAVLGTDTDQDGLRDIFEGTDVNDGFVVNDELVDGAGLVQLPDSDNDLSADRSNAVARNVDFDFRDGPDNDGDNVNDFDDIDDDNDGILDSAEQTVRDNNDFDAANVTFSADFNAQSFFSNQGGLTPTEGSTFLLASNGLSGRNGFATTIVDTSNLIPGEHTFSLDVGQFTNAPFADFTIELLSGGVVIGELTGAVPAPGTWTPHTLTLNLTQAQINAGLSVRIDVPFNGPDRRVAFDNFDVIGDRDSDGDGIVDRFDIDSDNDGITDVIEAQTTIGFIAPSGHGSAIIDENNDGLDDAFDNRTAAGMASGATGVGLTPVNSDATATTGADTIPDFLDNDSDGDGISDREESGFPAATSTDDTDQDGLLDDFESGSVDDGPIVNDGITPLDGTLPDQDGDAATGTPLTADLDFRDARLDDVPPVAQDDAFSINEDPDAGAGEIGAVVNGSLFADNGAGIDADALGDTITVTQINGNDIVDGQVINLASGARLTIRTDGTFDYEPNGAFDSLDDGETGTDSFTYTIEDPTGNSDVATVTVTISGDNDAPIIDLNGPTLEGTDYSDRFIEDQPGQPLVNLLTFDAVVQDDEDNIAVVTIIPVLPTPNDGADEFLRIDAPGLGLDLSINLFTSEVAHANPLVFGATTFDITFVNGVISITNASGGTFDSDDLEGFLRLLAYQNVNQNNTGGPRGFEFQVTDPAGVTIATSTITVERVNDAPVPTIAQNSNGTVVEVGSGDAPVPTLLVNSQTAAAVSALTEADVITRLGNGETAGDLGLISVADLLDQLSITDIEQTEFGIGVIFADESEGLWQYLRTDIAGHQWTDFQLGDPGNNDPTPVPTGEALLFDRDTVFRFIPNAGIVLGAQLQFRVWDLTVGVASNPPSTTPDNSGGSAPENTSSLSTASFSILLSADTDGDGIINADDLDDDNDGILDTDEGAVETIGTFGTTAPDDSDSIFEVTANNNASQLAEFLFPPNSAVTVSNAILFQGNGSVAQVATFDDADQITDQMGNPGAFVDFSAGIIFSTGAVEEFDDVLSNQFHGTGGPGFFPALGDGTNGTGVAGGGTDPDFVTPNGAFDVAFLSFDLNVTVQSTITARFVFASEEYSDFVNSGFNDAARILVNGQNVALTPSGAILSIDSINNSSESGFFVDNETNANAVNIEADGFTTVLTFTATLNPGTNTIKLGIADDGDNFYDSWLLFQANSFTVVPDVLGIDTDNDGIFDHLDIDSDDDGITDNIEAQSTAGFIAPSGTGDPDNGGTFVDVNRDGLDDNFDAGLIAGGAATGVGLTPVDSDADGIADFRDSDSDNDGIDDVDENGLGVAAVAPNDTDTDGDGLKDVFEDNIDGDSNDGFVVAEGVTDVLATGGIYLPDGGGDASVGTPTALVNDLDFRDPNDAPFIIDPLNPTDPNPDPSMVILPQSDNDADTIAPLDVSVAFGDPDGDTLSFAATNLPMGLMIDPMTGVISDTIDPSASQGGDDPMAAPGIYTVTVTGTDPSGESIMLSFVYTVTNPVLTAENDTLAADEDNPANGNLFADNGAGIDRDPDMDSFSVTRVAPGNDETALAVLSDGSGVGTPIAGNNGGLFTIDVNGDVSFDPNGEFDDLAVGETRMTSIVYQIDDGEGGTDSAVATFVVTGVNDAPVIVDPLNPGNPMPDPSMVIPAQMSDDAETVAPLDVSVAFSDPDASDPLTFSAVNLPAGLTIDPMTGMISGTLDPSASQGGDDPMAAPGVYQVTVTATDPSGEMVDVTFTYTVTNPAPIAQDDVLTAIEDTPFSGNLLASNGNGVDVDPDGDMIEVASVADDMGNPIPFGVATPLPGGEGTLTVLADGTVNFVPAPGFNGPVVFSYVLTDNEGGTDSASVTINVGPVNDLPVAEADALTGDEDTVTMGDLFADNGGGIDFDVDGDIFLVSRIVPGTDENDLTPLTDGTGVGTPVAGDTGGLFTVNPDGTVEFDPNNDFEDLAVGETRETSIVYQIDDGMGGTDAAVVTFTVTGANDAPVPVGPNGPVDPADPMDPNGPIDPTNFIPLQNGLDNTPVTPLDLNAFFADPDATDTLVLSLDPADLPPGLVFDPVTGIVSGTPGPDASQNGPNADGVYPVEVTATDPSGATFTTTLIFTINNPVPIAENDGFTSNEDMLVVGNLFADNGVGIDNDPDGDMFAVSRVASGDNVADLAGLADGTGIATPVAGDNGGQFTVNPDGAFAFDPNGDFNDLAVGETRVTSIVYQIDDGEGGVDSATVTYIVTGLNDAPIVVDPLNPSNPTPDPASVIPAQFGNDADMIAPIDVAAVLSDPDASDELTFAATNLPAGLMIDPVTGIITGVIDPSASQGGDDPLTAPGVYGVTVTATDPSGEMAEVTFIYTVSNPAPIAEDDNLTVDEATALTGIALFGDNGIGLDNDPDGDDFAVTQVNGDPANVGAVVTGSDGGLFTINPDGTASFDPNGEFTDLAVGEVRDTTITYTIDDGEGGTDTATVTVSVTGLNANPVPVGPNGPVDPADPMDPNGPIDALNFIPVQTGEDAAPLVPLDLTPFFADPDVSDILTISIDPADLPAGLAFDPATGVISGTPDPDASQGGDDPQVAPGIYTVPVIVTDGNGGSFLTNVMFDISNPPPVALDDTGEIDEDSILALDATAGLINSNDTDPDGDPLLVSAINGLSANVGEPVTGSNGGQFTVNPDGSVIFDPSGAFEALAPGEMAITSIQYTVSDGNGGADTAIFTVTVTGVNDIPTVIAVPAQPGIDGSPITPINIADHVIDPEGGPLTFSADDLPPGLMIDPLTGILSGTPDRSASQGGPNGDGVYPSVITVTDPSGAIVTINVPFTITNPAPDAVDDGVIAVIEDEAVSIRPLSNDIDPDGDPLTLTHVNGMPIVAGQLVTLPSGSTVLFTFAGSLTYTPAPDLTGPDSFTYTIIDGEGGEDVATVNLNLIAQNDLPDLAAALPDQRNSDGETIAPVDVAASFTDIDGDPLIFTATGLPDGLMIDPQTGIISGTLPVDASLDGPYTVFITATDPFNQSITVPFLWVVDNIAPEIVVPVENQSNLDGETVSLDLSGNFIDPETDDDILTFSATGLPSGLSIDPQTGIITGILASDASAQEPYTVIISVDDGQGGVATDSFIWRINNDNPGLVSALPNRTNNDGDTIVPVDLSTSFNDPDGDPLTFAADGLPNGLMIDPVTGIVSGTLPSGTSADGPFIVTVTASDGMGGVIIDSFVWTVDNIVPTLIRPQIDIAVNDGDPVDIATAGNFDDLDGDTLAFMATGLPEGLVIDPATGVISGVLDTSASVEGPFAVIVTATDSNGGQANDVFVIRVDNIAPIGASLPMFDLVPGQATSIDTNQLFDDPDGDVLTFTAQNLPEGLVIDPATGIISGTPVLGSETINVAVTADDGEGGITTITIELAPLRGAPIEDIISLGRTEIGLFGAAQISRTGPVAPASISAEPIVLDTVNAIRSLNGNNNGIGRDIGGVDTLRQLLDAGRDATNPGQDGNGFEGSFAFSSRADIAGTQSVDPANRVGQFVVDTFVRDRTLYVETYDTIDHVQSRGFKEFRATLGDGRALPGWISFSPDGIMIIDRPANIETVTLKITGLREGGGHVTRIVEIDTPTGEIRELTKSNKAFGQSFSQSLDLAELDASRIDPTLSQILKVQ